MFGQSEIISVDVLLKILLDTSSFVKATYVVIMIWCLHTYSVIAI